MNKRNSFFVLILSLLISFGFSSLNAQDNTRLTEQVACEVLTLEEIAQLLEVDLDQIKQDDMSFSNKQSICYYYTAEGNRKLFIRLAWKSEKAATNKVLEKQFKKYLEKGDVNQNRYVELERTSEHQLIYGSGKDRENKSIQIIRKRFGNNAEAQIELVKESLGDNVKDQLVRVLSKLN